MRPEILADFDWLCLVYHFSLAVSLLQIFHRDYL
jgi:hypothetical protein